MTTAVTACALVVLAAVVFDIATRRIPNVVTLGGVVAGLAIQAALGFVDGGILAALRGLGFALVGVLAVGAIPFLAWKRSEMGGGDVKLFAAIGALVGPAIGFDVLAFTFTASLLVLFPYRLLRHRAVGLAVKNMGIGLRNLLRARSAQHPYLTGPKLPPVILAPTIGVAFALAVLHHGVLR